MKANKVSSVAFMTQLCLQICLPALTPQAAEQDFGAASSAFQLHSDGDSFEAQLTYPGEEFLAAVFISDRGSSTPFNAAGDRFMDRAFLVALGASEASVYRTYLPMQQLLAISEDWYLQTVLLSASGRLVFGDIEFWPDLVAELPVAGGPASDVQFSLLVTEGIPARYQLYAEYEASSDDYELSVARVERLGQCTEVYFLLVTPGIDGGMHDVVEMHRSFADLGSEPGEMIRAYVGTRTQDEGDESVRFRVQEEFAVL